MVRRSSQISAWFEPSWRMEHALALTLRNDFDFVFFWRAVPFAPLFLAKGTAAPTHVPIVRISDILTF